MEIVGRQCRTASTVTTWGTRHLLWHCTARAVHRLASIHLVSSWDTSECRATRVAALLTREGTSSRSPQVDADYPPSEVTGQGPGLSVFDVIKPFRSSYPIKEDVKKKHSSPPLGEMRVW